MIDPYKRNSAAVYQLPFTDQCLLLINFYYEAELHLIEFGKM